MEQILQKMVDIEQSVKNLLEHASMECKALKNQADQECADYDAISEQQTNEKVLAIRSELKNRQERDIQKLQTDTEAAISTLDQYFRENHTRLSEELFKTILNK